MKKYFLFCLFALFTLCAAAQIENEHIVARKDSFPSRQEMMKRARQNYGSWMISAGGGYARWIAVIPKGTDPILKKYYDHLFWGFNPYLSGTYFLKFGLGFGLQYNGYFSSSKLNDVATIEINNKRYTGYVSEKISMQFFGGGIQYRLIKKTGASFLNFGVGFAYFVFNDNLKIESSTQSNHNIKFNGQSLGAQIHASYNYRIDPHFSIGLGIAINNGVLNSVNVNDGQYSYRDTSVHGSLIHIGLNAKLTIIL